jgi:hypothetical protein
VKARAGLLARRDFRLLWTGETTSCLGSSIGGVALPLAALSVLHASVLAVSALTAAAWLPWVLVGLPAGAWVDRLPRRPVMITAGVVSRRFRQRPRRRVVRRADHGPADARGARRRDGVGVLQDRLPGLCSRAAGCGRPARGQRQAARQRAGGECGRPRRGRRDRPGGRGRSGVLADAASFAVSALCLSRIRVAEPPRAARRRNLRHETGEGLAIVVRDPLLRASTVYGCLGNLTMAGYQAVLVVFLITTVGLSAAAAGALIVVTSLGGVLGALLARPAASRSGTARAVLYGRMLLTPACLPIPLAGRGPGLALFVLGGVTVVSAIVAGTSSGQAGCKAITRASSSDGSRPACRSSTTGRSRSVPSRPVLSPPASESGPHCGSCSAGWCSAPSSCWPARSGTSATCPRVKPASRRNQARTAQTCQHQNPGQHAYRPKTGPVPAARTVHDTPLTATAARKPRGRPRIP